MFRVRYMIPAATVAALYVGLCIQHQSKADPDVEPQRFEYQLWACRMTPEQGDGKWFCRSEGRGIDTAYTNLADCQESRDKSRPATGGWWFQCWRRPTWAPAEGRPVD